MEFKRRKRAVADLIMATVILILYFAGLLIYNFYYVRGLNGYLDMLKTDASLIGEISLLHAAANREFVSYEILFAIVGLSLVMMEAGAMRGLLSVYKRLAYRDILTGCRSRESLESYCDRPDTKRKNQTLTYFLFDVNYLKEMNDRYGRDKGDALLRATSGSLIRVFGRESVFRVEGGEFAVIYDKSENPQLLMDRVNDEIDSFNQKKNEADIPLSISKGFARGAYDPDNKHFWEDIRDMALKSLKVDRSTFRRILPVVEKGDTELKDMSIRKL